MSEPRRPSRHHFHAFQPLARLHGLRAGVSTLLLAALTLGTPATIQAGDILRGGASAKNADRNAQARAQAGAEAAQAAKVRAQDRLARTTKAVNDMRALQASARAAAGANNIPNGLTEGGLKVLTGANAKWQGANAPVQSGNTVGITQTASQALLHWETFNVGRDTTVNFDQSAGGSDAGKWIAFNKVFDPDARPSEIRGKINAQGQVYIINQNGIVFGAGSQVNTRALVASALPINDNLVANGLLNNKDAQFLFSALEVPGGSDGTPTFTPTDVPAVLSDVVVERGAKISSPELAGGNGGRVMLVGANVRNEGEISTPAGQTILAAGLQVAVREHDSSDPSLRGLDVWVGAVDQDGADPYAGTVQNTGLVEVPTGSIVLVGKRIEQKGILESRSSVNLNGRIDLLASYGAVANPNFDNPATIGDGAPAFLPQFTGEVVAGAGSLTRILPDYSSDKSIPGNKLPQNSRINIDAQSVSFDGGANLFAPSGDLNIRAGEWSYKDDESLNRTIFDADGEVESTLPSALRKPFVFTGGTVSIGNGAVIDLSGTPDVFVPLSHSLMDVQMRGNEFADSPLQRDGGLRAKNLRIDLRKTGVYGGRFWMGTPLGDATGLANIIERNAAQLTTRGGTIAIQAGESVSIANGAELNVSGGYTRNEGGLIQTTRLLRGGNVVDVANATPDVLYDGIYSGESRSISSKWGNEKIFRSALAPLGGYTEKEYIAGAAGGSIEITAPLSRLDGQLLGKTITGPKQLGNPVAHSSLALRFRNEKPVETPTGILYVDQITAPPMIVFAPGSGLSIPEKEMGETFLVPSRILEEEEGGFGRLTIENKDGTIRIAGSQLDLPSGGSLTLQATNIELLSSISIPGGTISATAYNYSPFLYAEQVAAEALIGQPAPEVVAGTGIIRIGAGVTLGVSGTISDERPTGSFSANSRRTVDGGSISLEGFSIVAGAGSAMTASGGIAINGRGKYSWGKGGSISLLAGKDPVLSTSVGGTLTLPSVLEAYSGSTGGSLTIQAVQATLGGSGTSSGKNLSLGSDFFQKGGFANYAIRATGDLGSESPAILVSPGSTIEPRAVSSVFRSFSGIDGRPAMDLRLLPEGIRNPANLSLVALGVDDPFTDETVEAIGSVVLGAGSTIRTDIGGSVSLKGQTISVFGTIETPAGSIAIEGGRKFPLAAQQEASTTGALPTVHLASSARLLARGSTKTTFDPFGRNMGEVLGGGTIRVSGNIIAESGALLDVSGVSQELDFHPSSLDRSLRASAGDGLVSKPWGQKSIPVVVDSNGGVISLRGSQLLLSDATLLGKAGGPKAVGGLLAVSSDAFAIETGADITLRVKQSGNVLGEDNDEIGVGRPVLDFEGSEVGGGGYFAADRFAAGGFAALDLGYEYFPTASIPHGGNIKFEGPVSIQAAGAIRVAAGGVIQTNDQVSLTAPYIAIGQEFRPPLNPSETYYPFLDASGRLSVSPTSGTGSLRLSASHVDVGTLVLKDTGSLSITANNGDIRGSGTLSVAGEVTLRSAQIYPTTLGTFDIFAYDTEDAPGRVSIFQSGERPLPLSAGGSLRIFASQISHAGTLRAPFGSITLGWDGADLNTATEDIDGPTNAVVGADLATPTASEINLAKGGTVSVSAIDPRTGQGIVIPFGISPDGNSWVDPRGVNVTTAGMPEKKVTISGDNIVQESGAVIDLRGGGDLLAYRWVSGTGGSADILGSASAWNAGTEYSAGDLVSHNGRVYSARAALSPQDFNGSVPTPSRTVYWLEVPESFAVLPGFNTPVAPYAPFNSGDYASSLGVDAGYVANLKIGDRIFLHGGSGLTAGTYTLLPRRYALLPGAHLVIPSARRSGGFVNAEGSAFVSGFRSNAFSQPSVATPMRTTYEIVSPAVLANRAEYATYFANQFIPQAAAALRTSVTQPLPRDSASLGIHGSSSLSLAGLVQSAADKRGIGAAIDISSLSPMTVGSNSDSADGVYLNYSILNSWGAESLLIGAQRRKTSSGTILDIKTESLVVDSANLSGPDIVLASKGDLVLQGASNLVSTGRTGTSRNLAINGAGALLRVSSDADSNFSRTGEIPENAASIQIEGDSKLAGTAVVIDSSNQSSISESAVLEARHISIGAGSIVVNFGGSSNAESALVLGGALLSKLNASNSLALSAYSSFAFAGSGTLGSDSLSNLAIKASGILGDGSNAILRAGTIQLSNPNSVSAPVASGSGGSLNLNADYLHLDDGEFSIAGYDENNISATKGVLIVGNGGFVSSGAVEISTPAIAASRLTDYEINVDGALTINSESSTAGVSSDLGARLRLSGSSVLIESKIDLPSGLLHIQATSGDVTIGSKLSVDGSVHTFYDTTRYADAGSIVIKSYAGDVVLNTGGILTTSAATGGGRAGLLQISAAEGEFQNAGTLLGKATTGYEGGSFQLDVKDLSDFAAINDPLEDGGFDTSRIFRVRTGDVTVDQAIKSHTFELAADGGSIEVSNTIDASGETGGRIALSASGSLTLLDGADLSVAAEKFNSAGKGGEIFLAAGSQLNGVVDPAATLNLSAGALNLAVESYKPGNYDEVGSSAFEGKFQGVLSLRAPRSDSTIQISAIDSAINGASAIVAEGYKLYDLSDSDGVMNIALRDLIHSQAGSFMSHENGITSSLFTSIPENFVLAPGVEIINRTGDLTLGRANTPTGLDDIEATSAADWDLAKMRYGSKNAPGILTIRASGDVVFNNSLSDGFDAISPSEDDPSIYSNGLSFDENGHSTLWLAQLQNINPDLPTNIQSWSYTITAGADLSGASLDSLLTMFGLAEDKGSIRVGEFYPAKSNPSDGSDDQSMAGTGQLGTTANNLRINLTEIDETTYVLDGDGNPVLDEDGNFIIENEGTGLLKDLGTRYEIVRTGTGDIRVHAARDVQLRNQFATIYTAGVAVPESTRIFSEGDFVVPIVNFDPALHPEQPYIGAPSQIFTPQWAMSGGNLKISAGNDIARVTQFTDLDENVSTIFDSSHQITSNWLYRRGHVDFTTGKIASINFNDATGTPQEDIAASTTWWIDYSNFFQGFGALGGGNVDLVAGNDVVNADAVAPTNARMAGRAEGENLAPSAENLLEFGGGDVSIVAGRNIDGGLYYVERGKGLIQAGASVKTNASRSPSLGLLNRVDDADFSDPDYFSESTWLPTAIFLGKGDFEISAKSDILLGPLANAFLMPAGLGNKFWYKTYFSTFSPETSVNVTSLGGSVTLRRSIVLPSDTEGTTRNILTSWMEQQNLFTVDNEGTASSNFQPWARLTETNLETFRSVLDLAPPTLKTTAFTGGVNVVGNLLLAPSAKGNMELLAAGAMKGLQVAGTTDVYSSAWIYSTLNVSDANPALIPSSLTPLSYYGFAGESGILYESSPSLLNSINQALAESGSYAGNEAAIDLKIKRHGTSLLHVGDENPVKIYAAGGDFSGFNVFTPKATRLLAGGDITDVALYIQNLNKSDISIVAAGGDILPYNESSPLRSLATDASAGNKIFDPERNTAGGKLVTALAGDIQVSGPGLLEVLAGRNLDLGTGENLFDGTGVGITSIGNARNPNLPFEGASLIALAGIQGKNGGAALGLANSQIELANLEAIDSGVTPVVPEFSTAEHEAVAGLQTLFAILQATGKDFPDTGSYEPALSVVQQAFASVTGSGDIFTRARDIRTVSGGSIALTAPKGALTMASDIFGNPLTPPGIVTEYGGSVSIITDGDVDIGRARIFTLRGGDMTIWSTTGDIAAGTSPKTVVTAPPTRVLIDSPSADVATDLGGLATGGGIGVLASVEGVEPGDVYLLAPAGSVDAGDAGIQSTGNLNIAAVAVVNADNIATGGSSAGVPSSAPAAAAPVSVAPSAATSTAATSSAAQNMASQSQSNKGVEESPSMISVEILGYGGGEGDNEDEEAKSASL
jgi:filamentous hemagglutinin family protein